MKGGEKIVSVKENKGNKDRVRHFTLLDIIGVAFFFLPTFVSFEKSTVWHSVRNRRQAEDFCKSQGNMDTQESVTLRFVSVWDNIFNAKDYYC